MGQFFSDLSDASILYARRGPFESGTPSLGRAHQSLHGGMFCRATTPHHYQVMYSVLSTGCRTVIRGQNPNLGASKRATGS